MTNSKRSALLIPHLVQSKEHTTPSSSSGAIQFRLENQGATCYLNALLQCFYLTPELRSGLFEVDPEDLGASQVYEEGQAKTSCSADKQPQQEQGQGPEEEPDEAVMEQLMAMGFSRPCAYRCAVASRPAADAVSAALEHALLHGEDPGMEDPLPRSPPALSSAEEAHPRKRRPRMIPLELQRLFSQLQPRSEGGGGGGLDRQAVSTHELTERGFQWTGTDGSVQHDAHELNRLLIDALEKSLKHTSGEQLCSSLYRGLLANQVECLTCHTISEREEPFYDLLLQVLGARDLAEALTAHVQPELLDGGNRYECNTCQDRRDSHRRVVLRALPPVLTFSCQRFDIDRSTWQRVKVTSEFRFPLAFSMQPFTEDGGRTNGSRQFLWLDEVTAAARRVAGRLVATYGEDAVSAVRQQLTDAESPLYWSLRQDMLHPRVVLAGEDRDAQGQQNKNRNVYQLFAVIVHHGSAHSGHYSACVRDVLREGCWTPPVSRDGEAKAREDEKDECAVGDLPDNLCYVLKRFEGQEDETERTFLVLENSPLHVVLTLISSSGNSARGRPSVAASSMLMRDLYDLLEANLADKTWNALHQARHGTLPLFLQHHSALLALTPPPRSGAKLGGLVSVRAGVHFSVASPSEFKSAAAAYSHDELVAQFCFPDAVTAMDTAPPPDNSSKWKTSGAGKKKKKKEKKMDRSPAEDSLGDSSSGKGEAMSSPVAQEEREECSAAASPVEEELAHQLLAAFHGTFFNFNDSSVTPIPLAELGSAFEGSSSAYILVYRNIDLDAAAPAAACRPCPPFWQARNHLLNEELREARREHETYMQTIRLTAWLPLHFSRLWPVLLRKEGQLGRDLGAGLPSGGMEITFDNRKTVSELITAILEQVHALVSAATGNCTGLGDSGMPLLLQALHIPSQAAVSDLSLSTLRLCTATGGRSSAAMVPSAGGDGFSMFAETPLDATAVVGDVLCDDAVVLLWGQEQVGGAGGCGGGEGGVEAYARPPKHVSVSFAAPGTPQLCTQSLWFPSTRSVGQLCRFVVEKVLLTPFSTPGLRVDHFEQAAETEIPFGKTTTWVTRCLYRRGAWQKHKGQANGQPWGAISLNDYDGGEICFDLDEQGAGGGEAVCLAAEEARRRNRLWCIHIKYDDEQRTGRTIASIVKELADEYRRSEVAQAAEAGEHEGVSETEAEAEERGLISSPFLSGTALRIEADCDTPLNTLKRLVVVRLLQHLPRCSSVSATSLPPALLRRVQFRTGHNLGVGVLEEEDCTLKECGLQHDAPLRLQGCDTLGGGATAGSGEDVYIRFCVVTGNDASSTAEARAGKHNPQQPGVRSLVLTLPLDNPEESLADMKQRALALHFAVTSQSQGQLQDQDQTQVEAKELRPWRLRKTNWADECTDELLFEVARSGSNSRSSAKTKGGDDGSVGQLLLVTVGDAVSSGSLKDNDLVLVEEGEAPDRDSLLLEVFLWPSHMSAASHQPPPAVSMQALDPRHAPAVREEFEAMVMAAGDGGCRVHPDAQAKLDWLPRLGRVKCSRHGSLTELYQACFEALADYHQQQRSSSSSTRGSGGEKDGLDSFPFVLPPSAEFLLLRDLQPAICLPGKVYRLPSAKSTPLGGVDSAMAMIGRGGGGGAAKNRGKGNDGGSGSKTLQRLGFGELTEGRGRLVLQLLEAPQSCSPPVLGQISIWVQQSHPVEQVSAGTKTVDRCVKDMCAWPPVEVIISGGPTPSFGHLRRPLLEAFPNIVVTDALQVFKHDAETCCWTELQAGMNNTKKGGRENILTNPYSLKDGSFLVVRSAVGTKAPDAGGRGVRAAPDRREDMFVRFLCELAGDEKKARRALGRVSAAAAGDGDGGGAGQAGRRRETEVMLKIGELDFSDDDEDGAR